MQAWQDETGAVVAALLRSAHVFTPSDVLLAVEGNPPPGVEPAEWRAAAQLLRDEQAARG